MARARQAAEALFAPKPPVTEKPSIDQSARLQRVLEGSPPPRREAIEPPIEPEPQDDARHSEQFAICAHPRFVR